MIIIISALVIVIIVIGLVVVEYPHLSITATTTMPYISATTVPTTIVPPTTTAPQELSGNVSITSYSCTSTTDGYGNRFYDVDVSGTATSPEVANPKSITLGVATNPSSGSFVMECGSWLRNSSFGYCYPPNGSPSSTSWHVSDNLTGIVVDQQSQGNIYVDARIGTYNSSNGYATTIASNSATVPCT